VAGAADAVVGDLVQVVGEIRVMASALCLEILL